MNASDPRSRQVTPRQTSPRLLALPRGAGLALVGAVALAVAVVPGAQALTAAHTAQAKAAAAPASRAGEHGDKGKGKGKSSASEDKRPPKGQACGKLDERAWWPFGNALHGQQVMETRDGGIQASVFQRGIVQSATDTSVTVLSKDNVSLTWTLTDATQVWRFGHKGGAVDLAAGQCVGIWGTGTEQAPTAKFVVVKWSAGVAPSPSTSPASPSASPSGSPSSPAPSSPAPSSPAASSPAPSGAI